MRPLYAFVVAGSLVGLNAVASAADPLAWLPSDVNAVARINVANLYKTPLAKQEGWLAKTTESFIHEEAFIPPGTSQIYMAAQLDLSDRLESHHQVAVLVPEAQTSLEQITEYLPGGIETISGRPGAQFGQDGYVADAGDGVWLTTTHSNRQYLARWLKAGPTSGGTQLAPYLQQALTSKSNTAQLILAIDLQENFSKEKIAEQLKGTDWFPSETVADNVAEVLASVYGITIGISVDQERSGIVTVDFGKDATSLKPVLDKLVETIMQRVGANTDDFADWKWTVTGSRVTGKGPVSAGGGLRLLSILEPPSITHAISASAQPSQEDKVAKTSQKYCRSIQTLLDDLRKTLRNTKDNHALWFERYGRKIDDLPKLNVDPALLDFAGKVSSSLRYQGQTQRMANITAGTQAAQSGAYNSQWYGYVGPYGRYGMAQSANPQLAANIEAEQNLQFQQVRFSEFKQIDDGLAAIRRDMTEKYQIEF